MIVLRQAEQWPWRVATRHQAMPWRIDNPNYQPADVAKNYNPDVGGAQGGGGHKNYLVAPANNVWWHGSASGDIGGGDRDIGLHVGDYQAAAENLNAILGPNPNHPQGRWDGKTSLAEANPESFDENGNSVPNWLGKHRFTHPDGTPMHGSYRPNVFPLAITGPMGNTTDTAVSDGQAHMLMRRQHTRPPKTPKGYYYINAAEGVGVSPETGIVESASATVPSVNHVQKLDPAQYERIAQEAHQNWYNKKLLSDRSSYDMSRVEGMPLNSMDRHQELQRQREEQERRALEWRDRRRGRQTAASRTADTQADSRCPHCKTPMVKQRDWHSHGFVPMGYQQFQCPHCLSEANVLDPEVQKMVASR